MHFPVYAAMVALSFACLPALAQNETSAASRSYQQTLSNLEHPNGALDISIAIKYSYKHTFSITPEQEAALDQDNSVLLGDFLASPEFKFSDDPKWVPGNKSVKIKEQDMSGFAQRKSAISAKWGKGKFTVSAKMSVVGKQIGPSKPNREPGHPDATTAIVTHFDGPLDFDVTAYASFDSTETETEVIKADGSRFGSLKQTHKTKSLVDAPPLPL